MEPQKIVVKIIQYLLLLLIRLLESNVASSNMADLKSHLVSSSVDTTAN
uniref:Uncharacterized protein n=1 Tax=mine drainage metagenome TaxID=410659 RepID=E6PYN7_9ZZZZ